MKLPRQSIHMESYIILSSAPLRKFKPLWRSSMKLPTLWADFGSSSTIFAKTKAALVLPYLSSMSLNFLGFGQEITFQGDFPIDQFLLQLLHELSQLRTGFD